MTISGSTRVFMILGDPIAQVQAPLLYNALFQQYGVDAVLVPAQVAAADVQAFARQVLRARNMAGLWLTIPHKSALLGLLHHTDRLGQLAGAVNAVRRQADGTLHGALFDGLGFVKAAAHLGVALAGQRVLLVGVGGAGMAIAASLLDSGISALRLFDANPDRAFDAARQLYAASGTDVQAAVSSDPAGFDVLINATPLGLQPGDAMPIDVARLDPHAQVIDILMKAQPTALLRACAARGIRAHPGHEMLVQQTPDYLRFFGFDTIADAVQADLSAVRRQLQPALAQSC